MIKCVLKAATPAELKSGGAGWTIRAGYAESPFGCCLVAECPHGICHLAFGDDWGQLAKTWPQAEFVRDDQWAGVLCRHIFDSPQSASYNLYVNGTAFQLRLWEALLQIPAGETISYGELAAAIGRPKAARAAGSAVGKNPIAFLIPCHRVVCGDGAIGGYHWGVDRKKAILAWEAPMLPADHGSDFRGH